MILLSLFVNVAVTFAVATLILRNGARAAIVFGPDSPARRILACVYLGIGAVSLFGLVWHPAMREIALVLLPLQIGYKILTAFVVGLAHPVVRANLAISALHAVTLATLLI